MAISLADVRWDVASALYEAHSRVDPDSRTAAIADHALTLTVERSFAPGPIPMRLHDVWRNAKFSSQRSTTRRGALRDDLRSELSEVEPDSPDTIACARESLSELVAAITPMGPVAVRVLVGMVIGESALDTSAQSHVPVRTVHRFRSRIRETARPILLPQAA